MRCAMSERWPVTIRDGNHRHVRIGPGRFQGKPGTVWIRTGPQGVTLGPAQCEELAQALVAACHEAEERVPHG